MSDSEDSSFDALARAELRRIEDAFADVDPDIVDVSSSDGMLRLDLRDGTRVVINSHRAAKQIWMAAVATAWHFDPLDNGRWHAAKTNDDLAATFVRVIAEHVGIALPLS